MPTLVGIEPKHIRKTKHKLPQHDSLHMFNGHCGCKCASCWYQWQTNKHDGTGKIWVGLCICNDCPCPVDGRKLLTPFTFGNGTTQTAVA